MLRKITVVGEDLPWWGSEAGERKQAVLNYSNRTRRIYSQRMEQMSMVKCPWVPKDQKDSG